MNSINKPDCSLSTETIIAIMDKNTTELAKVHLNSDLETIRYY